jgi:raffinose/stachyose/melibiose transport system substrate-binding protein
MFRPQPQWKRCAIALVALFVVGCSSSATTAPTTAPTAAPPTAAAPATPAPVTSAPAAALPSCANAGNITLNVGFSEAGEAILAGFKSQAQAFQTANPNVTVNVTAKDWSSSIQTIKLAMSGDNPPDVMQGNEGWAIDGALWKAGLLLNLDKYADAFGWNTAFPDSALMVNKFSDDGKTMGTGHLVAVPPAIQYVGVFYNKALLAQLGVTDVSTIDNKAAFLAVLDKAKAAKLLPVMLGDSDKWPALHNLSLLNGWYVTPQAINDWVFDKAGSTYNDAGHAQGATDFRAWMANGYFNSDALATSFNDATARFGKGEGVFFITGTWALGDVYKAMAANAGFMLFPAGASGTHAAVGGYSLPFTISSKTKYPDCAAAFVNYVTASPEAIAAQIAAGRPSATIAGAGATIDNPLLKQMVAEYTKLNNEKGLFTWEDWPTPTMFTMMESEAQLLLGGQITPAQYDATIQANWDKFVTTGQ